jgi:hypothetical protein
MFLFNEEVYYRGHECFVLDLGHHARAECGSMNARESCIYLNEYQSHTRIGWLGQVEELELVLAFFSMAKRLIMR